MYRLAANKAVQAQDSAQHLGKAQLDLSESHVSWIVVLIRQHRLHEGCWREWSGPQERLLEVGVECVPYANPVPPLLRVNLLPHDLLFVCSPCRAPAQAKIRIPPPFLSPSPSPSPTLAYPLSLWEVRERERETQKERGR
jgi:hypothetical protein